jgi:hypothetical protein
MKCRSIVVALALVASTARADDDLDARLGARALRLADHHYRAGEYYRAISGYEELALFATDDATRLYAAIRIAMSYHHGHQLGDAVERYASALALTRDPDIAQALRIQRALARAERTFDEPGTEALDAIAAELAPATTGGAYHDLAVFSLARIEALGGHTANARRTAVSLNGELAPVLARALARPGPSRRSPWLAMAMSAVVPGSGSVYGHHPVDGIYYFALTTLPALGAWDVYDGGRSWTDQKATFYGLATVSALFYAGSIVSAYIAVGRHNEAAALAHRRAVWQATDRPLPLESVPLPGP